MKCCIIPDNLLQELNDIHSLGLSKTLRKQRSFFKNMLTNMLKPKALEVTTGRDRNTHDCQNKTDLPGALILSEKSQFSSDQVLNKAHSSAGQVYDFYYKLLGRNSLDNAGMKLISSVHYDKDYNNAFWNGSSMTYGDGDGKIFIPLCNDISVVAHEFTHGVIQNTCNLNYWHQSGAANESYADKFGIACKHWVKGQFDPETANWLLGDEIIGSEFPGKALRSFKNEKAYTGDRQPKHMKSFIWTFEDNGGVHYNSGILNMAAYLFCLRLKEASYGRPLQIWYNALLRLTSTSGFKAVAKTEYKVALELYGQEVANILKQSYLDTGIKI